MNLKSVETRKSFDNEFNKLIDSIAIEETEDAVRLRLNDDAIQSIQSYQVLPVDSEEKGVSSKCLISKCFF